MRHLPSLQAVAAVVAGTLALVACNDQSAMDHLAPTTPSLATTAPPQFGGTFEMPVHVAATLAMSGCTNNPGPQITFSGAAALGGMGIDMIFRNNEKGTHEYADSMHVDVSVLPAGSSITIPKQPVLGGVGGNPFIWVQFTDAQGAPTSDEYYVGRCVEASSKNVDADLALDAVALGTATASGCENNPGPYITLDGALSLGGIGARIIFRNNDNPVGGPHENDETSMSNVTVYPDGNVISFPKQPVLGGVGGNPWIWAALHQGNGAPIGDEQLLGRCVQLSKTA